MYTTPMPHCSNSFMGRDLRLRSIQTGRCCFIQADAFPERVLGQETTFTHTVVRHHLRQASQLRSQAGIHQARAMWQSAASQSRRQTPGYRDRGHGAWIKGYVMPISRATGCQEAIPLRLRSAAQVPRLRMRVTAFSFRDRNARQTTRQRRSTPVDDSLRVKWLSRDGGAGLHLADEARRLSSVIRRRTAPPRTPESFEGKRVPLVEKATRTCRSSPQCSGIHAEAASSWRWRSSMTTRSVSSGRSRRRYRGSGGQEGRSRSGWRLPQMRTSETSQKSATFLCRRIEDQGRLAAHESGGLATLEGDAPDARILLDHGGQERHVPTMGKQR